MSNAGACLYVSTTQYHPLSPLSHFLLVWPTEGNSYSLVIMGRMMCALKCALPAWLPLRGARREPWQKAKEKGQGWGERGEWWESGVGPGQWIGTVITSERFDQISSIALCKWVLGDESAWQWSKASETAETDGEVWRLRYESSRSGGFTYFTHTHQSQRNEKCAARVCSRFIESSLAAEEFL